VRFDREKVTSIDWMSYPILEMRDAPEAIEVVLINRPEIAPRGGRAVDPRHPGGGGERVLRRDRRAAAARAAHAGAVKAALARA